NSLNPAAVRLPIAGQADGLAVALEFAFTPTNHDIYVQRTDAALNDLGLISIAISNLFQNHPSITSFSDGSLWVAFTNQNSTTDWDILARRVDAAGNTVGASIPIFDGTNVRADNSDLATLVNGNVVAVLERQPGNIIFNNDIFFTIKKPDG